MNEFVIFSKCICSYGRVVSKIWFAVVVVVVVVVVGECGGVSLFSGNVGGLSHSHALQQ